MTLPSFTAAHSLYAGRGRYRFGRVHQGRADTVVPAIPACDNCDDILDRCADNGGFPKAVCRACAIGRCYVNGPTPVPPPGEPFGGTPRG